MSDQVRNDTEKTRLIAFEVGTPLEECEIDMVSGGGYTRTERTGTLDWGDVEP